MSLGNKKGISSEDIFGAKEEKSQEIKDRYSALSGARAISSDMFFGEEDKVNRESDNGMGNGSSSNRGKQVG
jgi:hypothetical protein